MSNKGLKLNCQTLLEISTYLITSLLLVWQLYAENYKAFVSPRMVPWLIFMIVILILWSLSSLAFLFRPRYKKNYLHCLVLLVPVVLVTAATLNTTMANLGLPTDETDSTPMVASSDNTPLSTADAPVAPGTTQKLVPPNLSNNPTAPVNNQNNVTSNSPSYAGKGKNGKKMKISGPEVGIDNKTRQIVLNTNNYYDTLLDVSAKLPSYIGYHMKIAGFVTRNDQYYSHGDFMVARMAMTCCSADIAPVGVVAYYDHSNMIHDNQWVEIEGTIIPHDFLGLPQIAIKVNKLRRISPISGYVYPQ